MAHTKYFFAMFGEPRPPEKDTVESGIYHPDPRFAPFQAEPGDIMLLYCAGKYLDYPMEAPGVGIVLGTDRETVRYKYLSLSGPISMGAIKGAFEARDLDSFGKRRFPAFWFFEISRESFVKAMGQRTVVWP